MARKHTRTKVTAAALEALENASEGAAQRLIYLSTHALDAKVQLAAVNSILDRVGIGATNTTRADPNAEAQAQLALAVSQMNMNELLALRQATTLLVEASKRGPDPITIDQPLHIEHDPAPTVAPGPDDDE